MPLLILAGVIILSIILIVLACRPLDHGGDGCRLII